MKEPSSVKIIKTIDPVKIPFLAIFTWSVLVKLSVIAAKIGVIPNGFTTVNKVDKQKNRYWISILKKLNNYIFSGALMPSILSPLQRIFFVAPAKATLDRVRPSSSFNILQLA